MKRKLSSILMAALLLILPLLGALADAVPVRADEGLVLKLHYHREDGSYDDWDVWFWEAGSEGNGYPFAEEDGDMVATLQVTPGTTSVGFIVRTQDWTKDFDGDQFVDISEMISGTVHIYVESGVEGYTKEYGEDAVKGIKLKSASYNGDGTVTIAMTGQIDKEPAAAFTISGKDGDIAIMEATVGEDYVYTAVLERELDAEKRYSILYEDMEYELTMPIIYSTAEFEETYTYTGKDLGATWSKEKTAFRVWAPTADEVMLNLYASGMGDADDLIEQTAMSPDVNGTWIVEKEGDLNGVYYTYSVLIDGETAEACDPYARTTGVNGERAMVIDLASTNPEGWEQDANPHAGEGINDAVIYELHVRDLSMDENAGITNAGKFLGLAETGTKTPSGIPTGLDHIKELGVTHLHLLPIYDFGSVNEADASGNQFNWGYDPVNYNVPEGSYSTDPFNGEVRVKELKQTVQALHQNDVSVVMDVVYNHVHNATEFCFNKLVPGYFSRISEDGSYSSGSGCGNDTASERTMVKKYIVDSVCYWADEYHIDGFRFDLVGLLDTETINEIVTEVHKDHPDVIFYGEGWTLNTSVTKEGYELATQQNSGKTPGFAYFNDTIRDALKGNVFSNSEAGYVSGATHRESQIIRCFLGADSWCGSPAQTINYASCHDNMTLYDRLASSRADADKADLIRMNNLAAAVYMMAEGVPFMQAGEEMLRTKVKDDGTFDSNSYSSGDAVNCLKWGDLEDEDYRAVYEYYKGLIAFRKAHGALRLSNAEDVASAVSSVEGLDANVIAFAIQGGVNGETAEELYVIFNANEDAVTVPLPDGNWNIYINGEKAGTEVLGTAAGSVEVEGISAMTLVRENGDTASADAETSDTETSGSDTQTDSEEGGNTGLIIAIVAAVIAGAAVVFGGVFGKRRKNKQ